MSVKSFSLTVLSLSLLLWSAPALAQSGDEAQPAASVSAPESDAPPNDAPAPDDQDNADARKWHVTLTPVLWLANNRTALTVGDRTRVVKMDATEALSGFEAGGSGRLEATNGEWGAFADLFYIRLAKDANVGPQGNVPLSLEGKNFIWQFAGTYRVVNDENFDLDLLAGARGYSVDLDVTVEPFSGPAGVLQFPGRFASRGISFVDPILGAKANVKLSEKWDLDLYGDIGGFGAGSEFSYRAGANFGYQLNKSTTLRAGYVIMDFDYRKGSGLDEVRYDTTMYGPVLGAGIRF